MDPAPMLHPESGDPSSSRHFIRDHPRRTPASTLTARSAAIHTFVCQAVSHSKMHDYSITPGVAFQTMSAPVDDAFVTFHRDETGEALHLAATSAATALSVTITADMGDINIPKGYKHALNSPQAEYWQIAINKELSGLLALDTWSYVRTCDLPAGSNVMNCHYIFTVKRKADGSIDKFKARLSRRQHAEVRHRLRPNLRDRCQVPHHPARLDHRGGPRLRSLLPRHPSGLPPGRDQGGPLHAHASRCISSHASW